MDRRTFLAMAVAVPALGQTKKPVPPSRPQSPPSTKPVPPTRPPGLPWTQWGGPNRNFQTEASGIKDTWPATGPRVVWKRPLGEGYSSPLVESGVLYTMYGKRGEEVVLAANAENGETLWEQAGAHVVSKRRCAGDGEWPVLDAAYRRRPPVYDRRSRPPPMPRQEVGQAPVDAAALERIITARD